MNKNQKGILIIDDDSRNIFALSAVLKAKGYSLLSATSAKEGMQLLMNRKDIKVVLMDIMMPDMDGYEALRTIRSNETLRSIPVVAVTAQAMTGDREKCLEAGANDYIAKPINLDRLLQLLDNY